MSFQSTEQLSSLSSFGGCQLPHASSSSELSAVTSATLAACTVGVATSLELPAVTSAALEASTVGATAGAFDADAVNTGAQVDHHASSSDRIGDVGRNLGAGGEGGCRRCRGGGVEGGRGSSGPSRQLRPSLTPSSNIARSSTTFALPDSGFAEGPTLKYCVLLLPTTFTQREGLLDRAATRLLGVTGSATGARPRRHGAGGETTRMRSARDRCVTGRGPGAGLTPSLLLLPFTPALPLTLPELPHRIVTRPRRRPSPAPLRTHRLSPTSPRLGRRRTAAR